MKHKLLPVISISQTKILNGVPFSFGNCLKIGGEMGILAARKDIKDFLVGWINENTLILFTGSIAFEY